jgi:hypothetical protein
MKPIMAFVLNRRVALADFFTEVRRVTSPLYTKPRDNPMKYGSIIGFAIHVTQKISNGNGSMFTVQFHRDIAQAGFD